MTDVREAQLLAFVRYKDVSGINEHIMFSKKTGKTTGVKCFRLLTVVFKIDDIQWKRHLYATDARCNDGQREGTIRTSEKDKPRH